MRAFCMHESAIKPFWNRKIPFLSSENLIWKQWNPIFRNLSTKFAFFRDLLIKIVLFDEIYDFFRLFDLFCSFFHNDSTVLTKFKFFRRNSRSFDKICNFFVTFCRNLRSFHYVLFVFGKIHILSAIFFCEQDVFFAIFR